jgi:hypothetical protein
MGLIAAEARRRESRAGLRDFLERPPVRSYEDPSRCGPSVGTVSEASAPGSMINV